MVGRLLTPICCCFPRQQVSQMLAGQISNQDEEEVEDELEALESELLKLPDAPTPLPPASISERAEARARTTAKARTAAATSPVRLEA